MTSTAHDDAATTRITTDSRDRSEGGAHPFLRQAAGLALLAFPVVLTAGMATSPPQASDSTRDYVASLGVDPDLTGLSAGLLHYSWVLFALGVLATVGLVPGRRGRLVTGIVALVTSFSAIQISGLLLGDWFASAMARALPLDQAAALFDGVYANPWTATWMSSGRFVGFVGVPLLVAALAWARVLRWWLVALPFAGTAIMIGLGGVLPGFTALALGSLVGAVPMVVIGLRLLRRDRTGTAA